MFEKRIVLILVVIFAVSVGGCSNGGTGLFPPVDLSGDITLLIANTLGETLSIASRSNGQWTMQTDVAQTGQGANDIVVHGDRAYIVCSLSNSIHVVNTTDLSTVREISTGEGTNPYAVVIDDDGMLWVSLTLTNQLLQIDPDAAVPILRTIVLPGGIPPINPIPMDIIHPWPAGISYHKGHVYIAHSNLGSGLFPGQEGAVTIVNTDTGVIEEKLDIAGWNTVDVYCPDPEGDLLYFVSAGEYFFRGENGLIEVYDTSSGQVTGSVSLDGIPWGMVLSSTGAAYTTNAQTGEVLRFDANSLIPWPPFPLPDSGTGYNFISDICFTGNNELAVIEFNGDTLYIVDGITGDVKWSANAGDGAYAVAVIRWDLP